jgi:hypothetical protein
MKLLFFSMDKKEKKKSLKGVSALVFSTNSLIIKRLLGGMLVFFKFLV